jgi:hypothetical protein
VIDQFVRFGAAPAGRECSIPMRALIEGHVVDDPDFTISRRAWNRPQALGLKQLKRSQLRKRKPKRKKGRELKSPTEWVNNAMKFHDAWIVGKDKLRCADSIMDDAWVGGHQGDSDPREACARRLRKIMASSEGGAEWKEKKTVPPTDRLPLCGWDCNLKEKWISIPAGKREKMRETLKKVMDTGKCEFKELPKHRNGQRPWKGGLDGSHS